MSNSTVPIAQIAIAVLFSISIVKCLYAVREVAKFVQWEKLPQFIVNRFLPNSDDRDTTWEYVDRKAWIALSLAQTWGLVAIIAAMGGILISVM